MRTDTARSLVELLDRHAREQDALLARIQCVEAPDEFKRIRAMIGQTMGAIYLDALNPIFAEHPDLKPPHLRSSSDVPPLDR